MSLKPLVVEKGIVQPSFGKRKHSSLRKADFIVAGVLTNTGLPVRQSRVVIMEREIVFPSRINPSKTEITFVNEDAIYFCIPQNHFGHVLTGTMAFAYVLLNNCYANHKIVFIDKEPCESIIRLLEHLGVDRKNIMTINQYVQFKSVVVVKPSLRIVWLRRVMNRMFRINQEFIDTFQAIVQKINEASQASQHTKKVYFSRGNLTGKTIMCEDKIERVFKRNGYEIFYPEQLPLDEQIKLVANADFYACVQGTLEHHSLFMKDGATLIVMSRKEQLTERQILINKLQKTIKHIYLRTNVRPFGKRGRGTPNIIGATEDLIAFFNKYKFIYDTEELKPTYAELSAYFDKCLHSQNERCLNIIKEKLIKNQKRFWRQMK